MTPLQADNILVKLIHPLFLKAKAAASKQARKSESEAANERAVRQ